jgi:hypothetical protein
MNSKKICLVGLLVFLLFPLASLEPIEAVPNYTFEEPQEIDQGAPIFFLFTLNKSDSIHVQISSQDSCNYSVLLFNSRPNNAHVNPDGSLDSSVLSSSSLIGYNISVDPHLNFTDPSLQEPKMYYIEIILLNSSSDLFYLYSTKSLSRYYIPQIPGFPIGLTIIGGLIGSIILYVIIKRKKILLKF